MIYINFPFGYSSGGGNSFLNRLKGSLKENGIYSSIFQSKIIIYNSHHRLIYTLFLKIFFKKKFFVHRVDGPMTLYTGKFDKRDKLVYLINQISDFTIFQSQFSYDQQKENLSLTKNYFQIIHNGTKIKKFIKKDNPKIRIIIASWSKNTNKGFEIYQYLDKYADVNKYSIDFFGNSPYIFKNINFKGVVNFKELENKISKYDTAIIASKNDPCSNFLIECINNDLDILALNSGGHKELINNQNSFFNSGSELIDKLEKYNVGDYKNSKKYDINDISQQYQTICEKIIDLKIYNKINMKNFFSIIISVILIKLKYK